MSLARISLGAAASGGLVSISPRSAFVLWKSCRRSSVRPDRFQMRTVIVVSAILALNKKGTVE